MNTKKKRKGKVKHCTVSCTSEMVVKQSLCRPQRLTLSPKYYIIRKAPPPIVI